MGKFKKGAAGTALLVVGAAVGASFMNFDTSNNTLSGTSVSTTKTITLENIGELATQSALITQVEDYEKVASLLNIDLPMFQSRTIFSYDVEVQAGIDFADATFKVDEDTQTITVRLPQARVLSTQLLNDSLKVYEERQNIFAAFSTNELNSIQAQLKESAKEAALDHGLLENAAENAQSLVKGFLSSSYPADTWTYTFK